MLQHFELCSVMMESLWFYIYFNSLSICSENVCQVCFDGVLFWNYINKKTIKILNEMTNRLVKNEEAAWYWNVSDQTCPPVHAVLQVRELLCPGLTTWWRSVTGCYGGWEGSSLCCSVKRLIRLTSWSHSCVSSIRAFIVWRWLFIRSWSCRSLRPEHIRNNLRQSEDVSLSVCLSVECGSLSNLKYKHLRTCKPSLWLFHFH